MAQLLGKVHWDALVGKFTKWDEDPANFYTCQAAHVAEFIRDTVPVCRSLEVGCGTGLLLEHLLNYGYDAHACDISDGMVGAARARVSGIVDDPSSRVHVSTEDELPFNDDFGLVLAIGVFPCVADSSAFLQMLSRKLQGKGYVCAQSPNRFSLYAFREAARNLLRRQPQIAWNLIRTGNWSSERPRQCYSARSFDKLFSGSGYERVAAFGMYRSRKLDEPAPRRRGWLGRFLVRHLGWSYIAVYRKKPTGQYAQA